ncbi:MAG: hypothetical protein M1821_002996 [Bathelium mastoideum]|nr:MAG: hypothetical protein M1821_002996 [Bathelium mastoideum]
MAERFANACDTAEAFKKEHKPPVNLDFDARVPIPFSVFPSSYRSDAVIESTKEEAEVRLPAQASRVGREGHETRYASYQSEQTGRRGDRRYEEEDVRIYEEDRRRRPARRHEDIRVYEETRHPRGRRFEEEKVEINTRERYREPYRRYAEAQIDVEDREYERDREVRTTHGPVTRYAESELDITERDYRQRTRPGAIAEAFAEQDTYPEAHEEVRVEETRTTVDPPRHQSRSDMGYYDDDGHYHSFRHGLKRATDRVLHPIHGPQHHHHHHRYEHDDRVEDEVVVDRVERTSERVREPETMSRYYTEARTTSERAHLPNTITIPCHHIRIGDLVILQGRPCQVIRITTSAQTGQHRYLGVDLFTKQLHEESSFVSNPSPSVIVQNMLGPVFKQYRVLDIRDDGRVVAMTETGDVKQGLPVLDQSGLHHRLRDAYDNGRGSVRVLVINDEGRELAVDYKVVHGSRL